MHRQMTSSDAAGERRPLRPSLPALVFALMTVPVVMTASISLDFRNVPGGVTLTGATTDTAGLDFGVVSKYGSIAAGITRTLSASDYTLSSPFGVRVNKVSETSASYTLNARLVTTSVFSWKVDGLTLTTTFATLSASLAYGTSFTHMLDMVIADAQTTGLSVVQAIEFLAIAN